jgi:hypothetical protein
LPRLVGDEAGRGTPGAAGSTGDRLRKFDCGGVMGGARMRHGRRSLTLAVVLSLTVSFAALPSGAYPLAPPEAAVLTTRLLDGKV